MDYTRGIGLWKNEKPSLMACEYVLGCEFEDWSQCNDAILDWYDQYRQCKLMLRYEGENEFPDRVDHWAEKGREIGKRRRSTDFSQDKRWLRVRYEVLARDGAKCACCGSTAADGKVMHVDHIKPFSKAPELIYDASNLQVLCADCNIGKGNRDATDWRDETAKESA